MIGTWAEDPDARHYEWMAKYRKSVEDWNLKSDAIRARLHADLDDPVDTEREVAADETKKVTCQEPLTRQDVTMIAAAGGSPSGDRERAADRRWRTLSADDRSELRLEGIDLGRQLDGAE